MPLDGHNIRQTFLQIYQENIKDSGYQQQGPILREAAQRLQPKNRDEEQALLTAWNDLFRLGLMAWGYNLMNPDPPHVHLTASGRIALQNLSRDPYNPDGYKTFVRPLLEPDEPVALSYIDEALETFQARCLKATAVMAGAAAESLVLSMRDALVARLGVIGTPVPSKLQEDKVKTIRDAVKAEIDKRTAQLDRHLRDRYALHWGSMSEHIRQARNDAGHPASVDPVTHEIVHASLLMFPEFARLVKELKAWITMTMV
jgi:hypothetical protein